MPQNNPRIPFRLLDQTRTLTPIDGKPLMVHIVVNVEVWPFGKPMPRTILKNAHGKSPIRDIGNFSWVEYGLRLGLPRLERIFSARKLPVTNMMNAAVIDFYPQCAELAAIDPCVNNVLYCGPEVRNETYRKPAGVGTSARASAGVAQGRTAAR